ncbi:MAG: hypothetical protein ACK4K7_10395 [Allosphingosinicella sp.]|uniref:hypothetical protein n=1 Tax=Allosphingosinicella sp. TaxID=2823234 RepID=UPI003944832F
MVTVRHAAQAADLIAHAFEGAAGPRAAILHLDQERHPIHVSLHAADAAHGLPVREMVERALELGSRGIVAGLRGAPDAAARADLRRLAAICRDLAIRLEDVLIFEAEDATSLRAINLL